MTGPLIVLWRHGRTALNAAGRLQGQSDIDLDDVGRAQAQAAAAALAALVPTKIVSSDLRRARDTASALAEITGVRVEDDPRLRERNFGLWEGLDREEIERGWPTAFAAWRRGREPEGIGADSRRDVAARMHEAILEHAAGLSGDDVVVVVSHGAAITLALSALLSLDPQSWFGFAGLDNCHWAVLAPNPGRSPGWRLTAHNVGAE
ncbi:MAG TPA: histidine phosphatase family protein [Actinomycetaceae bacterium]|nr:histidine phosphatase family protein [Actinomycetaceae bacterium]